MVNFKLAELRKKGNLTQQELSDILCVSYQTISKWENGVVLPDITMLPKISGYFGVSVDALLGLVPLEEEYRPAETGKTDYWEKRLDYLKASRERMWNEDYMRFLIRDVWRLDKPVTVLDCGCGYGALGRLILPLLPTGSRYVGVDFSSEMIRVAKKIFEGTGLDATFIVCDMFFYKSAEKYDLVIGQALLRHVDNGEKLLRRMTEFAREGGLVVSVECNREFEADGLYIRGLDYAYLCQHAGLKKLWQMEMEMQNRDYSIAMKIPHYMKTAGLKGVSCRMNDRVTILEPDQPNYREAMEAMAKAENWNIERTDREIEETIAYLMNHGMNRKEAEDYCRLQNRIVKHIRKYEGEISVTKTSGMMISYGWK